MKEIEKEELDQVSGGGRGGGKVSKKKDKREPQESKGIVVPVPRASERTIDEEQLNFVKMHYSKLLDGCKDNKR